MPSLQGFQLDLAELGHVGRDLARPECVLAERDGTLWVSDGRGIATRIDPDGSQALLGPEVGEPNGMAIDAAGDLIVATMTGGKVWRLRRDGRAEVLLDSLDGAPLGAVNFCLFDHLGRLWISVSTRRQPWWSAVVSPQPDGYVILVDEKGPRVVADGLVCANEVRLDARGEHLYAVETLRSRVVRFPIRPDGSLGEREVYGPDGLPGRGSYIDGITFDAEGNLWATTICRNGIVVITPSGDAHTVVEEPNEELLARLEGAIAVGAVQPLDLASCAGATLQLPTSITFGGPDLRTVYVGSLAMPRLPTFRSPVPGLPLSHWR